jgi:hypothetical protein
VDRAGAGARALLAVSAVLAATAVIPSAIFAALLFSESLAATELIGRILDRTDLQDVAVPE